MSTTQSRINTQTGRAAGNVMVQDYQTPAYATPIAITTTAQAGETLVKVGTLTGDLSLTIGTTNPLIGDVAEFLFLADASTRNVTFSTGFASSSTLTIAGAGRGYAKFEFNGTNWTEVGRSDSRGGADIQSPAYAATISLTTTRQATRLIVAQLTGALTINAVITSALVGDVMDIAFSTDGTQRIVTFGTNIKSSGTLTIPASKWASVRALFDGTFWLLNGREIAA